MKLTFINCLTQMNSEIPLHKITSFKWNKMYFPQFYIQSALLVKHDKVFIVDTLQKFYASVCFGLLLLFFIQKAKTQACDQGRLKDSFPRYSKPQCYQSLHNSIPQCSSIISLFLYYSYTIMTHLQWQLSDLKHDLHYYKNITELQ